MIIDDLAREWTPDGLRLSAAVDSSLTPSGERLHFTVHDGEPEWMPPVGDAFLAAMMMPAMALREDVRVHAPVSRRLFRSAFTIADIYTAWWPHLHSVELEAPVAGRESGDAVGLFFTAGVDSFYSLIKDVARSTASDWEPVTHLVFVNFERQTGARYEHLLERLRHVASRTGKRLLVVDTNVRSMSEPTAFWPEYHGAALAAVALSLQGLLRRCLIAASHQYRHMPPLGSHPLLDNQFSTEGLEIVHDGAEATRADKIFRLASEGDLPLDNLCVCWSSEPGHNCGRCQKCVGTMVALELAGASGKCPTLPGTLDLEVVRAVTMPDGIKLATRALVSEAENRGRHDIADALREALRRAGDLEQADR
ncbi:hypothetical protein [Actinokineospora iranica]|uniref:7-cyano-7-deazaguanine synthase (Queuosine biosynthesis) n=1 Tax=Actinokineospora iranica TaxID=1271860 RepID=A0A1G6VZX2_9PSEU|nr:hypothetical protein [Actinokineospora iranica]SDD59121.1 hypothetical protein SAMN05216174_113186 [Actinokineospora iranica]